MSFSNVSQGEHAVPENYLPIDIEPKYNDGLHSSACQSVCKEPQDFGLKLFPFRQPNGRFETGKKICLSMSAHHPETWQPSWSSKYQ